MFRLSLALYKQEERNSIVPGTYSAYDVADKGKTDLGDWQAIDEEYVTFPMTIP